MNVEFTIIHPVGQFGRTYTSFSVSLFMVPNAELRALDFQNHNFVFPVDPYTVQVCGDFEIWKCHGQLGAQRNNAESFQISHYPGTTPVGIL